MAELQRQVTGAVNGFFGSDGVQLVVRLALVYLVALWLAAAWWAFRDAENRTGNRAASYVAAAWVVLFSPLLFPFALLVYRLVRPPELLADIEDRRLAETALLADSLDQPDVCPRCGRIVQNGWIACPSCRLVLAGLCGNCGRATALDWSACAWCGGVLRPDADRPSSNPFVDPEPDLVPVMVERRPVLAAAGFTAMSAAVDIPSGIHVDPPPFIAPRERRHRPIGRRPPRTASRKEPAPDRQTA